MRNGYDCDEMHYWSLLINTIYLSMHTARLFYVSPVPSVVMTNFFRASILYMYCRSSVQELMCFQRETGNVTLLKWQKVTKSWLFYSLLSLQPRTVHGIYCYKSEQLPLRITFSDHKKDPISFIREKIFFKTPIVRK